MKPLLGLVLLLPIAAAARYSGPAVETCRACAEREIRRADPRIKVAAQATRRMRTLR